MKENDSILINGEYYSHHELVGIIESNRELAIKNERQTRFIKALKINNSALTIERNKLVEELNHIKAMGMFEFANTYCNEQDHIDAGHAFARSLGVGL